MDIFKLSVTFARVVQTWKHGTSIYVSVTISITIFSQGKNGTPLACAASKGHVNIISYLLGQNVDVNGAKVHKINLCNSNSNYIDFVSHSRTCHH